MAAEGGCKVARTTGVAITTTIHGTLHTVIGKTGVHTGAETTTTVVGVVGSGRRRRSVTRVEGILKGSSFVFEGGDELLKVKVVKRGERWSFRLLLLHGDRRRGRLGRRSLQARVRRRRFGIFRAAATLDFGGTFLAAAVTAATGTGPAGRSVLSGQGRSRVIVTLCTDVAEAVVL